MAKHPVPKKKTAKATSRQRYGSFKTKVLNKLTNRTVLTDCTNCGEKKRAHMVCEECGQYRGRQVVDKSKKIDKITTVKV